MATAKALLVGLKSVDPKKYGGWDGKAGCWGCELDVDNIAEILSPLDYQIATLKTKQATRSSILEGLKSAASTLKSGDTFVFYFSGHGGQQPDANGDETDGRDETLVAYDGEVIDDELNAIWTKFKTGVRLVMLSDSCNSGTNYRNLRTIERPTPFKISPTTSSRMKAQMIHFGGCRDGSTSNGYQSGGAFTIALCDVWDGGNFSGNYKAFQTAIKSKVSVENAQVVQYNEYGPVSSSFRNEKPFSISGREMPADGIDEMEEANASVGTSAGGFLSGPRFGSGDGERSGGRSGEGSRAAGGVIAKQTRVDSILRNALGSKLSSTALIRYGDGTYYLPTLTEMKQLLAASQSDRRTWTAERFDCDDFSYVLKGESSIHSYNTADFRFGICCGIIWGNFDWVSGYHAVNWFIDATGTMYLIEPQTDAIYPVSRAQMGVGLVVV